MLIGRKKETELLQAAVRDNYSHFIAVYGRRRVGKTFLIRETFGYRFTFQHSGLSEGGLKEQLFSFSSSTKDCGYIFYHTPQNWLEAFEGLKELIRSSSERKKIIFIDELSWMDTPKSDFMTALENFWNGFASARNDIILIVCASATSWMLSRVIHNKGGLYNRLTEQIHLQPFTLKECEDYVRAAELVLTREQILQYYMIFGGIPFYWKFLKKGLSLTQNIDQILFAADAPLNEEYNYLFASIFKSPEPYTRIIEALAVKKSGMTREELVATSGLSNSGDLTKRLDELESCGFLRKYNAFGMKSRNAVYQLIDNFTLFSLQFMGKKQTDDHYWTNQLNTPKVNTWIGLAFERICLLHTNQIKASLGITGVLTDVNSWYCSADPDKGIFGSQIDLLIVRKDNVINLCEMKYCSTEYTITDKVYKNIQNKLNDLSIRAGIKYALHPTLVTTYGLVPNSYSNCIQSVVTMDDLFAF